MPFVGEIRIFAGSFPPSGWVFCDGQLLAISENETLFQLIGTTYGGDGQTTFGVPDLRGRLPAHQGSNLALGETGGVEGVTLTVNQIPAHAHALAASLNQSGTTNPPTNVLGQVPGGNVYIQDAPLTPLSASSIGVSGGSQSHANMQPYLCVSFILSLFGVFPSPT